MFLSMLYNFLYNIRQDLHVDFIFQLSFFKLNAESKLYLTLGREITT